MTDIGDSVSRLARLRRENPLYAFVPNPTQYDFMVHQENFLLGALGANKMGKSTLVAVEGIAHSIGRRLWFPPDHPLYIVRMPNGDPIRVPNVGQVVAADYPNGIDKIQWKMWRKWLPRDCWRIHRKEHGVIRELRIDVSQFPWVDRNSDLFPESYVYFMAYEQGRTKFAGIDPDWILNDEPPPRNLFVEQIRGLVSTGGKWMGAMTCVDSNQVYIYDEFFPSNRARDKETQDLLDEAKTYCVVGTIYDNLYNQDTGAGGLKMENIRAFASRLTPEERAVRLEGKMLHLTGTEYGDLWNPNIHVVPHREPDPRNAQIMACDAHPTKPYAILWAEVDPYDRVYVYCESYDRSLKDLDMIAQRVKEVEGWRRTSEGGWIEDSSPVEPVVRLIDPIATTKEKARGLSAVQVLGIDHDLHFMPWARTNKASRNRMVREFLRRGEGPTGSPRLTISENCKELIYEIPRYREKLPKDPSLQERKGDMVHVDDDLVQSLIAICNLGFRYWDLMSMKEQVHGRISSGESVARRRRSVQNLTAGY